MLILRGPHIQMGGFRGQQVVVKIGILHPPVANRLPQLGAADRPAAFATVGQRFTHDVMGWHIPAHRGLHRQASSGGQHRPQTRNQLLMVGHPLNNGVGVKNRRRRSRLPIGKVAVFPHHARRSFASLGQHFGRIVHANDAGGRPTVSQHAGDVAAAATQVIDYAGIFQRNAPHQVQRGAYSVVGEFEILSRVPGFSGDISLVGRRLGHR